MTSLSCGFRSRLAMTAVDIRAAQRLRHRAFTGANGVDADPFDAHCTHVLVEPLAGGDPVACCRLALFGGGAGARDSYSGQFYDLGPLAAFVGPVLEIGRFCSTASVNDPAVLRLLWAEITRVVDGAGVELMFGCASFPGNDPSRYAPIFASLGANHLAPASWRPGQRSGNRFALANFAAAPGLMPPAGLPPLLRSYLKMGGRVSDHGVIDASLGTLHVFTGVEVAAIPETRKRLLRADAMA